ncbi:MAG TPA: DUF1990 domain-containing protein [Pyrinomonadaceae bacterium]|jgi:uncharacterized protein (UPF0548 family)
MFLIGKPFDEEINDFIAAQSELTFSYPEVGETKTPAAPEGYPINHLREKLGEGKQTYRKAVEALRSWQMYSTNWTELRPKNAPIKTGEIVVMLVNHLGFWSLNPCRIVYSIEEETAQFCRNAFAIGTLPAHSEAGEERFTIEWNRQTDEVYYELYAFARAHNWLAKIGFPFVPLFQKRFAADSYRAMLTAINS